VAAVLGMLGLEEKDVADGDTLESLGMDSMQVAEIRARLQRALGRPIPLEEVRPALPRPRAARGAARGHRVSRAVTWACDHIFADVCEV
jgi:acyl carrier protein